MRKSGHVLQLILFLLFPAVGLASVKYLTVWDKHWTSKYDSHFRKYAKRYFGPQFNWHWFKAQGIAESSLKPDAKSRAGAAGIMQILPSTFKYIRKRNPHFVDVKTPRWNIAAGIYYDKLIYGKWKKKNIPASERLNFSFGSYNAGYGRILKAWKKARKKYGKVSKWKQVEPLAPKPARVYVKKIRKLMGLDVSALSAPSCCPIAAFPHVAKLTCPAGAYPDQGLPALPRQYCPAASRLSPPFSGGSNT